MQVKRLLIITFGLLLAAAAAQETQTTGMGNGGQDLKVGDIAPSWALMYAPAKFEFLKTWSVEKDKRLRLFSSQPDRHAVLLSFFATWCMPCMKELPILEEVFQQYKDKRIKFFLIDITEATRSNPIYENVPKAGPFLKKKGVTMRILYDNRGTVKERYNAQTLPRLFILDGNQIIRMVRRGFHEGDEEIFKKELSDMIDMLLAELPAAKNGKGES